MNNAARGQRVTRLSLVAAILAGLLFVAAPGTVAHAAAPATDTSAPPVASPTPTIAPTATPTATPIPPTATPKAIPPTATSLPPTATRVPPTATAAATPTTPPTVPPATATVVAATATTAPQSVTKLAAPTVATITPDNGTTAGDTTLTLTGADFQSGATVLFDTTASPKVTFTSATSLTVKTPTHAAGVVDVVVTNPDAQRVTVKNGYTFVAPSTPTPTPLPATAAPATSTVTATATAMPTVMLTSTAIPVSTATPTSTPMSTATVPPTITPTSTATAIPTQTPTPTATPKPTVTATPVATVVAPTIAAIGPGTGATGGGTTVTITGAGFTAGATVTFDGASATAVSVGSATTITATTPVHAAGPVTVVVTTTGGSGTKASGFTYIVLPPTISGVTPRLGPTDGGTSVTIAGTHLLDASRVTLDGAPAAVTAQTDTQLVVTAPPHTAGAVDLSVTTGGGSATSASAFTYQDPAPAVSGVSPLSGPAAGGTSVTITGAHFAPGAKVTFGGAAVPNVAILSDMQISMTTPAGTAGSALVVVTNADTQSSTPGVAFTYLAAPTIASITPNTGPVSGGTSVTISGDYLDKATVRVDGLTASVTQPGTTSIVITTPAVTDAHAADVTVTTAGGTATITGGFTYQAISRQSRTAAVAPSQSSLSAAAVPTITTVSPASGTTNGGTSVVLTGTGFTGATGVTFGGAAATAFTVNTDTQITATAPAHAAGAVNVSVTTSGGTGTRTNGYTYTAASAPTVTSLNVTSGTTNGGTAVTITGTNFVSGTTVTFGGVAATNITVVSATSITAKTPAHAAGAVNVVATNPDGQTGTRTNGYTYVGILTITAQPANFSYSGTLTGAQINLASSFAVGINDSTGNNAGWNVQATVGTFTAGADTIAAANHTIQSAAASGTTGTPPTNGVAYPVAIPTASGKVYNAAVGTGTGQATVTFSSQLAVPSNAAAGTYITTLTVTVAAGP